MKTVEEIQSRLSAIAEEAKTAEGDALKALEDEQRTLSEELTKIQDEAKRRQDLRDAIARGIVPTAPVKGETSPADEGAEARAKEFVNTRHMVVPAEQTRSTLISGGTLLTPTKVEGINDIPGAKVSSIIDLCQVVNCVGMGSDKVAYIAADEGAAAEQVEGVAATSGDPTFAFVTITPDSVAVVSYISKQAQRQTPLLYQAKVQQQALLALRKKAAIVATNALKASTLNTSTDASVNGGKGVIDDKTLRKLTMNYGGDESILGTGILFLNKTDLVAFGDVRGTNEKKAVYEITPDTSNPNTGIIRDGGLSVRYCINSNLTACAGTAQGADAATSTMFYGDPQCLRIDLFSDYEINVSADFKFDQLMLSILGDVELGSDVVVQHGFVALTIPKVA
jgi:Phage capsid family.